MKSVRFVIGSIIFLLLVLAVAFLLYRYNERTVLKQIIARLAADSRIAEVIVTESQYSADIDKTRTTIKFVEYDASGIPLEPHYFTFSDNLLQFQSLVIRFDDDFVKHGVSNREKSAYIFWKVFHLDGVKTEEYELTTMNTVPEGYRISTELNRTEEIWWERFWDIALDKEKRSRLGIKNAQIEAPGTRFVPGKLYTLYIEHDGGIRIDVDDVPQIMRGERIL
jgi:hypothetical protein